MAAKPRDLRFPPVSVLSNAPPFVSSPSVDVAMRDIDYPSVDWSTTCPIFCRTGECKHGQRCRFLGGHIRKTDEGKLELVTNEEKKAQTVLAETELNFVMADILKQIRSKKVKYLLSDSGVICPHDPSSPIP